MCMPKCTGTTCPGSPKGAKAVAKCEFSATGKPPPTYCGLTCTSTGDCPAGTTCELPTGICAYPYPESELEDEEEMTEMYPASFQGNLASTLLGLPSLATPSMLKLGGKSDSSVTFYKIEGDECGQSTIDSKYAVYAKQFGGLLEGALRRP